MSNPFVTIVAVVLQFSEMAYPARVGLTGYPTQVPDYCEIWSTDDRRKPKVGACFREDKQVYYGPIYIMTETI